MRIPKQMFVWYVLYPTSSKESVGNNIVIQGFASILGHQNCNVRIKCASLCSHAATINMS